MNRITVRGDHGIFMADGWDFEINHRQYDHVQKVLDRLAAYEDTGFEPNEIPTAKEFAEIACALEELKKYKDAEGVNREDLRTKGKWIGIGYDGYADGYPVYDHWECSNCGNEESGEDVPETNPFCRCCGTKMEE